MKNHEHYLKNELYSLLKEDGSIFEFIHESSLDGIWYWDLENPEHEWMSSRFWEVLGYAPEEKKHLVSEWKEIIFEDDFALAVENVQKHLKDPTYPYDQIVRYRHKDGSTVWIRCRGMAIRDENGKPIRMLGAHNDMTQVINAMRELEDKEAIERLNSHLNDKFTKAQAHERDISRYLELIDKHIITSSTDLNGHIVKASEAFCQISGYEEIELIGRPHSVIRHPDMPSSFFKTLWETIRKDETWRGEVKNLRKDGSYYWVDTTISPTYDDFGNKIGYTSIRIDITNKKKVEELSEHLHQEFLESEKNKRTISRYVELIDQYIITSSTDLSGRIVKASEAFCKISGYEEHELIGKPHSIIRHPDMPTAFYHDLWETIQKNETWQGEVKNLRKDGSHYWVDTTITPTYDDDGKKIGYTSIRIDITNKKKVEELSITDPLTGIFNRRYFNDNFTRFLNSAKRNDHYFCFVMCDIDHFKEYNDTYGHIQGDEALVAVAQSLKSHMQRAQDNCFRLGGEEFGITYESLSIKDCHHMVEKMLEDIEELKIEHEKNNASEYVTVSIGLVCVSPNADMNLELIYKSADQLLYRAKEKGRNRIEYMDFV